jgi:hypothetical protein
MIVHNKGLRRLVVLFFVLAAALVVGFDPGDGPLAFEDDRPLELKWVEVVDEGTHVVVRNVGDAKLEGLRAVLTGFNFEVGKEPKQDDEVLSPPTKDDPFTLDAGEGVTITIKATGKFIPDPDKEYKGLLVVSGRAAGMIRREVIISGPPPDLKPTVVKSAVGEMIVVQTPLTGSSFRTVRFELPLAVDGDANTLPISGTIGIVRSDKGHLGYVKVDSEWYRWQGGEVVLLPVRIDELDAPGTYEGTVDLTAHNDDKDALQLKVTVTDPATLVATDIDIAVTGPPFEGIAVPFRKSEDGTAPAFFGSGSDSDKLVGFVIGPDQAVGKVYVTPCKAQPDQPVDEDIKFVCLRIAELDTPGTYKGEVDVTDNDVLDALTLTVTVPNEAKPLVTKITARGIRIWSIGIPRITGLRRIEVPLRANADGQSPKFFEHDEIVGGISGADQVGKVFRAKCRGEDVPFDKVCLEVKGLGKPGEYTGKVDVTNNNDDSDAFDLTVAVTDWIVWPILVSLCGIAFAFVTMVFFQGWKPRVDLGKRRKERKKEIESENHYACGKVGEPVTIHARGKNWSAGTKIVFSWGSSPVTLDHEVSVDDEGTWWASFDILGAWVVEGCNVVTANAETGSDSARALFVGDCARWKEEWANWNKPPADDAPTLAIGTTRRSYRIRVDEHFANFDDHFDEYKKRLIWDTSSEDYQHMTKMLDTVQADIKRFREQFGPTLAGLEKQLEELQEFLAAAPLVYPERVPQPTDEEEKVPDLVKSVAAQLRGTDIPIGKLQERLDLWADQIKLMKRWRGLAIAHKRYTMWVAKLESKVDDPEKEVIARIKHKLAEVRHEMYVVAAAEDLTTLRIPRELDAVYRRLARLGSKYGVWVTLEDAEKKINKAIDEGREDSKDGGWLAFDGILERVKEILRDAKAVVTGVEELPLERLARVSRLLDVMQVVFAIFVAVFTALQSKYFVPNFGAWYEYVALFLFFAGGEAALVGVLQVVGRLFERR